MKLDLLSFQTLIKERCGLLFEGNGTEKLAQSLAERIAALAIPAAEYYARLYSNEGEFQQLVNLLTINETYFFREPEQIRLLVERLAPRFIAAHAGAAPVRILSAGCSSGEEPYSLVMALMDKYGDSVSRLFSFTGGDIDSTVLAKARAARYTDFSFRGVAAALRQRYFDKDRWGSVLKDEVRRQVSFHELNLLADHFPPELSAFDIIFFRNVSIYFDAETRKRIQRNLAALLKANGVLVIGTAETLANDLGVLPLIEENGLFYFIKGTPPSSEESVAQPLVPPLVPPEARPAFDALTAPILPVMPVLPVAPPLSPLLVPPGAWSLPIISPIAAAAPSGVVPSRPLAELARARQLIHDKHYDEALPQLDAVLSAEPGNAEAGLLKAHVLINRKDFAAAAELAQRVLVVDAWSIDALLVLGLAAKWCNQAELAINHFKQAAYACHECWPAHYYLAELYRANGEAELARRAYRSVIQLLSGADANANCGIKYVPFGLPAGEVRFLCEHQLVKLPATAGKKAALATPR